MANRANRASDATKPLLKLRRLKAKGLEIDDLRLHPGEAWAVLGETGAGMDALTRILAGDLTGIRSGECVLPKPLGLLSFAGQQARFEEVLRNDDTDFINRLDPGASAAAVLREAAEHRDIPADLVRVLNLEHVLDRGWRHLSSGEAMKIGILAELCRGARLLVLEHPFDGLDQAACRELNQALARLHADEGLAILLLLGDAADLPPWCENVALLADEAIREAGPAAEVLPRLDARAKTTDRRRALFRATDEDLRAEAPPAADEEADEPLIALRNGFARYGEVEVFSGLTLVIRPGEHTLITGPNGCGKSTLVQLITGDHPLCYQNDLRILGRRRGGGESIWDVKRHMGIVSGDLHRNHRVHGTALAVVLSGLFDSIGLYSRPTAEERARGLRWLARLGLEDRANQSFRRLGYGEQRLLLLARALIKRPRLLLLDEPTQGLDQANRRAFLDFLEQSAAQRLTTIVYISHRADEYRPFFRQRLEFRPEDEDVPFRVRRMEQTNTATEYRTAAPMQLNHEEQP